MKTPVIRVIDCFVFRRQQTGDLECLLLRRSADRIYAGNWRMVGGKIKDDEPAWKAALREVWEETGLLPLNFWSVPYINQFYEWESDRISTIPVFALLTGNDPVKLDAEHDDFQWLPVEKAVELLPLPAQKDGLTAAYSLISGPDWISSQHRIPIV